MLANRLSKTLLSFSGAILLTLGAVPPVSAAIPNTEIGYGVRANEKCPVNVKNISSKIGTTFDIKNSLTEGEENADAATITALNEKWSNNLAARKTKSALNPAHWSAIAKINKDIASTKSQLKTLYNKKWGPWVFVKDGDKVLRCLEIGLFSGSSGSVDTPFKLEAQAAGANRRFFGLGSEYAADIGSVVSTPWSNDIAGSTGWSNDAYRLGKDATETYKVRGIRMRLVVKSTASDPNMLDLNAGNRVTNVDGVQSNPIFSPWLSAGGSWSPFNKSPKKPLGLKSFAVAISTKIVPTESAPPGPCGQDGESCVVPPTDPGNCSDCGDVVEPPPSVVPPQCSDGVDNDGDGKIDWPADLDCSGPGGNTENPPGPPGPGPGPGPNPGPNPNPNPNPPNPGPGFGPGPIPNPPGGPNPPNPPNPPNGPLPQCSDGIDNDHDGFIDFPKDPDCRSRLDNSEASHSQEINL